MFTLNKYRACFPKINENTTEIPQYQEKINLFQSFLTKCQQSNTANREAMMNSVKNHKLSNKFYVDIYTLFEQYEHSAVEYFSDNQMEKRVLTHPKAGELREEVANKTG